MPASPGEGSGEPPHRARVRTSKIGTFASRAPRRYIVSVAPETEGKVTAKPSLVEQKLETLPATPGCYLFKDKDGAVVYVGKAKSLRSRVRSYFQEGGERLALLHPDPAATLVRTSRRSSPPPRRRRRSSRTTSSRSTSRASTSSCATTRTTSASASTRRSLAAARARAAPARRTGRATSARTTRRRARGARCTSSTSTSSSAPARTPSSRRARRPVPPVPDQALPGAVRARGRRGLVRRAGARGRRSSSTGRHDELSQRARGAHAGRLARAWSSSSRRSTATSSAPSTRCARSSASSPIERRRSGRRRALPRGRAWSSSRCCYVRARAASTDSLTFSLRNVGAPGRGGRRAASSRSTTASDGVERAPRHPRRGHRPAARCPTAPTASPSGCRAARPQGARSWCRSAGTRVDLLALAARTRSHAFREKQRASRRRRGAPRASSRSASACPRCRAASSAATSRTSAAATRSARSSRCSTASPTRSATGRSTCKAWPTATTTPRCTRCWRAASAAAGDASDAKAEALLVREAQVDARAVARAPRGRDEAEARSSGSCPICSSSTAAGDSSPSRSRRRAISACTSSPIVGAREGARDVLRARRWSIASTCPGRRTASRSARAIERRSSSSPAPATRRTGSPTARARSSGRSRRIALRARRRTRHRAGGAQSAIDDARLDVGGARRERRANPCSPRRDAETPRGAAQNRAGAGRARGERAGGVVSGSPRQRERRRRRRRGQGGTGAATNTWTAPHPSSFGKPITAVSPRIASAGARD